MEKTAVEWLVNELKESIGLKDLHAIEKAKQMDKKNLYTFYIQGGIDCITEADRTVEDFYNETFKTKE
jgi:hypothetical protein